VSNKHHTQYNKAKNERVTIGKSVFGKSVNGKKVIGKKRIW